MKIAYLDVFENTQNNIVIQDIDSGFVVAFDECMAEKLCKAIMKTAKQIREHQNENE